MEIVPLAAGRGGDLSRIEAARTRLSLYTLHL